MYVPELIRKEGLRRGLSPRTIKTYNHCVERFFRKCRKEVNETTKQDVKDFLDRLIEKGAGGNTINVYLNALKFFYGQVLNRKLTVYIRYSKTPKSLPTVLTKEEVTKLISAIENPKHGLMVKLIYSAGLRVSELVHLKVKDLELDRNHGWVRKGKGNKDRMFIIARNLKNELMGYIYDNNLDQESWLFAGQKQGCITAMAVQKIIKKAARKAAIKKNVHPHTLRHSFATHLIENNYDVCSLQFLLGHNSPETTMVYVHAASKNMINVKSPFDSLAQD